VLAVIRATSDVLICRMMSFALKASRMVLSLASTLSIDFDDPAAAFHQLMTFAFF
jgi:hypothetical protein